MEPTNEEKILTGLRSLFKQNQLILATLNGIGRSKFSLINGMIEAKALEQKQIEELAKEFGGETIK